MNRAYLGSLKKGSEMQVFHARPMGLPKRDEGTKRNCKCRDVGQTIDHCRQSRAIRTKIRPTIHQARTVLDAGRGGVSGGLEDTLRANRKKTHD